MVRLIDNPARIPVPGGKLIDEHQGGRTEVHAGQASELAHRDE
jgi:hypothetical protein